MGQKVMYYTQRGRDKNILKKPRRENMKEALSSKT